MYCHVTDIDKCFGNLHLVYESCANSLNGDITPEPDIELIPEDNIYGKNLYILPAL